MQTSSNIYREEILEHFRRPQNHGKLANFSASSKQLNPFCGDEIELFIKFDKDTITEISFIGRGCAISIAGASLLTEFVKGKPKTELKKLNANDILNLLGIEISETRKKCALLGLSVLKDCLD